MRSLLLAACLLAAVAAPATATPGWRWPVRGEVVKRFALGADPYARGQHRGVDVAAPRGTNVRAACAGRVRFAGRAGSFGRAVTAACGEFVVTYGHLAEVYAAAGERVRAGERIGEMGTHLHLGVRRAGERQGYVDPLRFLPADRPATGPPSLAPPARRRRPPLEMSPAAPTPISTPVWIGIALLAAAVPGLALVNAGRPCTQRRTSPLPPAHRHGAEGARL